jgi:hypothetical protein
MQEHQHIRSAEHIALQGFVEVAADRKITRGKSVGSDLIR